MTEITWFTDSPDVGPDCYCSKCGEPIKIMAIRVFDDKSGKEARFHQDCFDIADFEEEIDAA